MKPFLIKKKRPPDSRHNEVRPLCDSRMRREGRPHLTKTSFGDFSASASKVHVIRTRPGPVGGAGAGCSAAGRSGFLTSGSGLYGETSCLVPWVTWKNTPPFSLAIKWESLLLIFPPCALSCRKKSKLGRNEVFYNLLHGRIHLKIMYLISS